MILFLTKRLGWNKTLPRPVRRMQQMVITGVALGVAALVVTLSVAGGFEQEYKKALLNFNAHVLILPDETMGYSEKKIKAALKQNVQITPYLLREALVIHNGKIKGVVLKGVQKSKIKNQKSKIVEGVQLGKELASELGVDVSHSHIKLLIPGKESLKTHQIHSLPLAGTFQSGLYEIDSQFIHIDLNLLQKLFGLSPLTVGYELRLADPDLAPEAAKMLQDFFGPLAGIQHWMELHAPLFEALQLEKWAFRILMGLMVFAASLNLIGAILIFVFRKKRMIAILQTLGLPLRRVRLLFSLRGLWLGSIGVLIGLSLALLFLFILKIFPFVSLDPQIYFLRRLPLAIQPLSIFMIAVFSLFLIWVSSWFAAGKVTGVSLKEGLHGPGV